MGRDNTHVSLEVAKRGTQRPRTTTGAAVISKHGTPEEYSGWLQIIFVLFFELFAMSIWSCVNISQFGVAVSLHILSRPSKKKINRPSSILGRCVSRRPNARSCHPLSISSSRHVGFKYRVLSLVSLFAVGK